MQPGSRAGETERLGGRDIGREGEWDRERGREGKKFRASKLIGKKREFIVFQSAFQFL